jgi:hypothetical protein
MVVCKDRIERNRQRQQMGVEAAAVVESDIANLLAGKSYEHLVTLQRQIQAKLASNEPLDVEYWEGLLKKVLVYKAQVTSHFNLRDLTDILDSRNSKFTMKLLSRTVWSNFANDSAMKPYEPSKSFLLARLLLYLSTKLHLQPSKRKWLRRPNPITDQ